MVSKESNATAHPVNGAHRTLDSMGYGRDREELGDGAPWF